MPLRERVRRRIRGLFPREDHTSVQHESMKQDGQDAAASTSALPIEASTACSSAPTGLAERLWDRAYDGLKTSDSASALIQAYERILSRRLSGQGFDTPVTATDQNIIAQHDTHARRAQMRQLIQDGLDRTAREAKIKQSIGDGINLVLFAKNIISSSIQAAPQAGLAWAGVCVGLEIIQSPLTAMKANRDGIDYVIKKMDWYWTLASAVLENKSNKSGLSDVRQELETQVVDLYATLLSYQIKSVCSYYRNRGFALLRDIAGLDDWNGDIKAIRDAERAFYDDSNTYANLKVVSNLDQLVSHAETQSNVHLAKEDQQCIKDLRLTDPVDDKKRIEQTKGGLLQDSYRWILDNPEYQQWHNSGENRLLWIKGDPGKGKTMLLCGIINELDRQQSLSGLVSYFFFQATDQQLNNATAALRGLILLLVRQQPSLISHVRKRYDEAGEKLFEGANTWFALSDIFTTILLDPVLKGAYLVVDALDECVSDQQKLLDLIVRVSGTEARVKWIVSSRNLLAIEERLQLAKQKVKLSLELNAESIANAVKIYIGEKVHQLSDLKGFDENTHRRVRDYLLENANDTFLWVALVCQNLEKYTRWKVPDMLDAFPPGLDSLYERMMSLVLEGDESDVSLCKHIFAVMMNAYRPITLQELGSLIGTNSELSGDVGYLWDIVALCGSFLTIREDTVYFVHQSANDYLSNNKDTIFASSLQDVHQTMASLSLQAMTRILRKNMYALSYFGLLSDDGVVMPEPDPLSAIRYPCVHWVDHLCKGPTMDLYLEDNGPVCLFLREHLLHWLEALSLLHQISAGVLAIAALKDLVAAKLPGGELLSFLRDAHRFVLYNRRGIELAPLQVYSSALVCSPSQSLVRKAFQRDFPTWIQDWPAVEDNWSPCLQTLEGHTHVVNSISFSADLMQIASGSHDNTIKTWDIITGACIQTLKGHTGAVRTVAFTADSRRIVSGSYDKSIKIWDPTTGACHRTLWGHTNYVFEIAFLENDQVASASRDATIKIWDIETGSCLRTLEGHTSPVWSVAFLASGLVVSGGEDRVIKIWDIATGMCNQTLEGHTSAVSSVTPLANGQLVSGSYDQTVRLWDLATGTCIRRFNGHQHFVTSTALLANGQIASASSDGTNIIWDMATGTCIHTIESHDSSLTSVVSLSNGQIASGSDNVNVKIWDTTMSASVESHHHQGSIRSITLSSDGRQVASGAADSKIRIWDADTGACIQTLVGHADSVRAVSFLPNGLLASGSDDKKVKLWDVDTGACVRTFQGHDGWIRSVAASADGQQVASGSDDKTVKIWDTATGECIRTLDGHRNWVLAVAWSMNGRWVASGADDGSIMIYNEASGSYRKLGKHYRHVKSVAVSTDGLYAASGAFNSIKVWHIAARKCILKFHVGREVYRSDDHLSFDHLSFDPAMRYRIYSNFGYLDLDLTPLKDESDGESQDESDDESQDESDDESQDEGEDESQDEGEDESQDEGEDESQDEGEDESQDESEVDREGGGESEDESEDQSEDESEQSSRPPSPSSPHNTIRGYGIDWRRGWIVKDGKPLFWLPPEYRSEYSAAAGSTVAVSVNGNHVSIFKFSDAGPE
ncbi:WD40 repeat-like protein [Trichoderma aethiopicum]